MPTPKEKQENIKKSYYTIYDPIKVEDVDTHYYSKEDIEEIIRAELIGESFNGMPLRTRSKVAKKLVCLALGYNVPNSFKKTQPRFPSQNLDNYVQKTTNLQVWNEEIDLDRRYLILICDSKDVIVDAHVITGKELADLDKTGTLTQKYQARIEINDDESELIAEEDTDRIINSFDLNFNSDLSSSLPTSLPEKNKLLPIKNVYDKLLELIGASFADEGADQERNRGAVLHRLVCEKLGYNNYADTGQFPDVRHQLLEVKLQTSPTIDLGLVLPSSDSELNIPKIGDKNIRHKDVRYAVFYGKILQEKVVLTNLIVTTGERFFSRFVQFQGKVLNRKLQIHLPKEFFNQTIESNENDSSTNLFS